MANILDQGAAWLADQLKTHASTEVVYQRGADQVALNATIGKTEFEIDDGTGIIKRVQSRDFLIQTADLQLAGTTTLPLAGDRIREKECVIVTIRPDPNSWRPHNLSLDAHHALSLRNRLNALFRNSETLDQWMEREGVVLEDEYHPDEE